MKFLRITAGTNLKIPLRSDSLRDRFHALLCNARHYIARTVEPTDEPQLSALDVVTGGTLLMIRSDPVRHSRWARLPAVKQRSNLIPIFIIRFENANSSHRQNRQINE
jgi:hypothetical protein